MAENETDLIRRAKENDTSAFEELIAPYHLRVYNHACRMVGNPHDGEDLAQEVFLRAYMNISKFKGNASFSTWLYKITSNVCLDELRKRKRAQFTPIDEGTTLESAELSPEENAERRELREAVLSAVSTLSPEHRQVILLRETEGLSYDEIAQATRSSPGTVKSRINRARAALKKILAEQNSLE